MMEDPRNISACMHLHFIAKNVERWADHATSIAEQVIYLATWRQCRARRARRWKPFRAGVKPMKPLVLLVEDEAAQREVLRYNLEAERF